MKKSSKEFLLKLSRKVLEEFVRKGEIPKVSNVPRELKNKGAVFVTLTKKGNLRGCIGHIFPLQEIWKDVVENTINACSSDIRFYPVKPEELKDIKIEISVLSKPEKLKYNGKMNLLNKLSNKEGLIISYGGKSAVFLPQVWEQLPKKEDFLSHLCAKAGLPPDFWETGKLDVMTFKVESFEEGK